MATYDVDVTIFRLVDCRMKVLIAETRDAEWFAALQRREPKAGKQAVVSA